MDKFQLFSVCCQLIIFTSAQADSVEIPEIVKFSVSYGKNEEIPVSLVPTYTYLANENLPVWIPHPEHPSQLMLEPDIMKDIASFTVYRDPSSCASALYYHKRKQFDGSIGHHHIIWRLNYNSESKQVEPTDRTLFPSSLKKHNENRLSENKDVVVKKGGNLMREWTKSLANYPKTVYIETLVIVDYKIADELRMNYSTIVSYVLMLMNSVDMIFSSIEIPKIKINIAGIIIRTTHVSFRKLIQNSCYERSDWDSHVVIMDGVCAIEAIRYHLDHFHSLPEQSYDIAVFLTKYPMFHDTLTNSKAKVAERKRIHLLGLAMLPIAEHGYRLMPEDTRVAIITNTDILMFIPVIAHEIAHLLGVPHDEGPLWKEDGTCDAHLMKKDNSNCRRCFKFGGSTPEHLKRFFSSRDSCIFHNEPRSLKNPPGPRIFWNEDEQCKCYGYKEAHKSLDSIRNGISGWSPLILDCETRLKCVDDNGKVDDTAYYMDGTPCDKNRIGNKVCWHKKCLSARRRSMCEIS